MEINGRSGEGGIGSVGTLHRKLPKRRFKAGAGGEKRRGGGGGACSLGERVVLLEVRPLEREGQRSEAVNHIIVIVYSYSC